MHLNWVRALCFALLGAWLSLVPPALADGYDAAADPTAVLDHGLAQARETDRQVLLIAGGAWCSWCVLLDRFIAANPDVRDALDARFVVVHVYAGQDNPNAKFFKNLPPAEGYPHFWILDRDGRVLQSVNTSPLEAGKEKGYDKAAFLRFVQEGAKG